MLQYQPIHPLGEDMNATLRQPRGRRSRRPPTRQRGGCGRAVGRRDGPKGRNGSCDGGCAGANAVGAAAPLLALIRAPRPLPRPLQPRLRRAPWPTGCLGVARAAPPPRQIRPFNHFLYNRSLVLRKALSTSPSPLHEPPLSHFLYNRSMVLRKAIPARQAPAVSKPRHVELCGGTPR